MSIRDALAADYENIMKFCSTPCPRGDSIAAYQPSLDTALRDLQIRLELRISRVRPALWGAHPENGFGSGGDLDSVKFSQQ